MASIARHEVQTLAEVLVASACEVRRSLGRATKLDLERVDDGSWNRLAVEYALLHLFLLSEHAHQVLEEAPALALVGEIADRVSTGLSRRLGACAIDKRAVSVYFGETLKERFSAYQRQPIVVDPNAGEMVEIDTFDRVRGTVFGTFVETLGPLLCQGRAVPPAEALELWLDILTRAQTLGHVYTPVVDMVAVSLKAKV